MLNKYYYRKMNLDILLNMDYNTKINTIIEK